MELAVRDASDRIVWRIANLGGVSFPFRGSLNLAPGTYTFEAEANTGTVRSRAFEVEGLHREPMVVRIDVR